MAPTSTPAYGMPVEGSPRLPLGRYGGSGHGAYALRLAFDAYVATEGKYPQSVRELEPYLLFKRELEGFRLRVRDEGNGTWTIRGERFRRAKWDPKPFELTPEVIKQIKELGGDPDLLDDPDPREESQVLAWLDEKDATPSPESVDAHKAALYEDMILNWRLPHRDVARTRVQFQVALLTNAFSTYLDAKGAPPRSLDELAEHWDGINAAGWTNPYTGRPMREVLPPAERAPGDYSIQRPQGSFGVQFYVREDISRIQPILVYFNPSTGWHPAPTYTVMVSQPMAGWPEPDVFH